MRKLLTLPFIIILAACTSIGLAPASSFNDKLAYAYGSYAAVQQAAATSLNNAEISSKDGENILALADKAKVVLDGAKVAADGGDTQTAEGRLQLGVAILTELQNYLRSRKAS